MYPGTPSSSDIEIYKELRALDLERSRLVKRFEMSPIGSPEQSSYRDAIQECDQAIDSLIGTTPEEQKKNLDRIMMSVQIFNASQQEQINKEHQYETGVQQVGKGLGCGLVAALVSGGAYLTAGPGDYYVVFWGAMAWGAWMFIKGLLNIADSKRQ